MRIASIFLFLAGIIAACMHGRDGSSPEETARSQAITVAKDYALSLMKDAKESSDRDGIITLTTDGASYVIDPVKIVINEINEDSLKDAIVPMSRLIGQTLVMKEHLLIINSGDKMAIDTVLFNIINILKVEEREIIVEISKVGMDSPGYGCADCMEIAKYKLREGKLERTE